MARESTIKFEFELQNVAHDPATLRTPGITAGTTTVIALDAADPGVVADPAWYVVGDALFIDGTGWASLDGKAHIITAFVDGATPTVTIGTDTSAETAPLPTDLEDITVTSFTWTHVCLSEFTPNPGTPGEIDATTMCDTERKNLPGLPTAGTASFTGMFDLDDAGMNALIAAQKDAVPRYLIGYTRQGQAAIFHGVVSSFSIGALTVEAAVTFTGTFTLDESPYYMKRPVTP